MFFPRHRSRRTGTLSQSRSSRRHSQLQKRRGLYEQLEPRIVLSVSALGEAGPLNSAGVAPAGDPNESLLPDHAANEILIGFEGQALDAFRLRGPAAALRSAGIARLGLTNPHVLLDNQQLAAARWTLPEGQGLAKAIENISQRQGVKFAEPNYAYTIDVELPNDELFGDLYGLHNTGQDGGTADADIDAPEAWTVSNGSRQVVVGVIDTGIDYTHPDLYLNVWLNQGEIPTDVGAIDTDGDGLITFVDLNDPLQTDGVVNDINGNTFIDAGDLLLDPAWEDQVDQDANGYVDDLIGWDWVNDDNDPYDDNSHGTHVSGTIGALTDNTIGVAGVVSQVSIIGLKFLNSGGGGNTDDAVAAVNYAAQTNAKMTSNSWGGGGFSETLESAIANSGQMFVAAAGNGNTNTDASPHYPSSYELDNIVSVAATDRNDAKASFSNWGLVNVDLAAPGVDTMSTIPGGGYATKSGTSMATPHVAGVAALAWSIAEQADWLTIRNALLDGGDPNAAFATGGANPIATGDRLNAFGTLEQLGFIASLVDPPAGGVTTDIAVQDFTVDFSYEVDGTSVDGTELLFVHDDGTTTASFDHTVLDADTYMFHFRAEDIPLITTEGVQTVRMDAGSIEAAADVTLPGGSSLKPMTATFRYDELPLDVVETVPAGPVLTLPVTTLEMQFNEVIDVTSLTADDLRLSGGRVTEVTFDKLNNRSIATFQLAGINAEGTLDVNMRAGAVTDVHGNPMVPYLETFTLDFDQTTVPVPLSANVPRGSLAYTSSFAGTIYESTDVDVYSITLDPDQTLVLSMQAADGSALAPAIDLYEDAASDPVVPAVISAVNGAVVKSYGTQTGGPYTVRVSSTGGSVGGYSVHLYTNTAFEDELAGDADTGALALDALAYNTFTPLTLDADRSLVIGGIEDNGCTMPDGYGYEACLAEDFVFEDISTHPNAQRVLQTAEDDDAEFILKKQVLDGFTFPFYGQTYNQVVIGSNGQITFELERVSGSVRNNSPINSDLTTAPGVATIAPFWDDLEIVGENAGVYWEVMDGVLGQELIIQFEEVRFWGSEGTETISFQVILSEADGLITVHYEDLVSDQPGAEGTSATVGIKDVGEQGANRLLLAHDDGPNQWVGTGKTVQIGVGLSDPLVTTEDRYQFELDLGQSVTIALVDVAGQSEMVLIDPNAAQIEPLAGVPTNVDQVITLPGGEDGKYVIEVTGDTRSVYHLFVLRDGAYDLEPNSGPLPWAGDSFQGIDLDTNDSATVLGNLGGAGGNSSVVGYFTDFNTGTTAPEEAILQAGLEPLRIEDITTFDLETIDILMLNESNNGGPSAEVAERLPDIETWVRGGGVFMVHDRFVTNDSGDPQGNPFLIGVPDVLADRDFADGADIDVIPPGGTLVTDGPHGEVNDETLDGGNSSNHGFVLGATLSTIDGRVETILSAGPEVDDVVSFSYELTGGYVYYSTIPLDWYLGGENNFDDIYAPNMLEYGNSLVNPEVDFFEIDVPNLEGGGTLTIETLVPGAEPGEFRNLLNSKIQLYQADGTLVDSGDGAGQPATLAYPLPGGTSVGTTTYYVQIMSSDAPDATPSQGEYVALVDVEPIPPGKGITINKSSLLTDEDGATDPFTVVLDQAPDEDVTIRLEVTDDSEALLKVGEDPPAATVDIYFTPSNWAVVQNVTVIGRDDFVVDGDVEYSVTAVATSQDTQYNGLAETLPAINLDNDTVKIVVVADDPLRTDEDGGRGSLGIRLNSEPLAPVNVTVDVGVTDEGLLDPDPLDPNNGLVTAVTLNFTTVDWNIVQEIEVVGLGDDVDDGNVGYDITLTPASDDTAYGTLDPVLVPVINVDSIHDVSPMVDSVIDDFEDGSLSEYTENGNTGTSVALVGARDGEYGLVDSGDSGWLIRTDAAATVGPGDVVSVWVRSDGAATGRAYFGFSATTKGKPAGQGTLALVMAPNSNSFLLQGVNKFQSYTDLASAPFTWEADTWYRMEAEWSVDNQITGRLYDSDGTTPLAMITATNTDYKAGGIAFRSFAAVKQFDNVELRTAPGGSPLLLNGSSDSEQHLSQAAPTDQQVQAALDASLAYWAAAGVPEARINVLRDARLRFVNLPDSMVGLASNANSIWLDHNAAGVGWSASAGDPGVSLTDVLTHELGHEAGFDHGSQLEVMMPYLDAMTGSNHELPTRLLQSRDLGQRMITHGLWRIDDFMVEQLIDVVERKAVETDRDAPWTALHDQLASLDSCFSRIGESQRTSWLEPAAWWDRESYRFEVAELTEQEWEEILIDD